jgi:uncharacterized protein with HEPN domain
LSKGRVYALQRIRHMIAAADAILSYTNRGRSAFENDSTVRDAILYQIVVIGEAAKAVVAADETIAAEISSVEWSLWAKIRDRITHQYWATDREIVWSTATHDVPALRANLLRALMCV